MSYPLPSITNRTLDAFSGVPNTSIANSSSVDSFSCSLVRIIVFYLFRELSSWLHVPVHVGLLAFCADQTLLSISMLVC